MKFDELGYEIKSFYVREGKLRLIFNLFLCNGSYFVMGNAEYVNKPESRIDFAYTKNLLYKSRNDFPRLKTILYEFITNQLKI